MSKLAPAGCSCEYPCSCVSYEGVRYGGMDDVIAYLERRLERWGAVLNALESVEGGAANRVDGDDFKVYTVSDLIRLDIKTRAREVQQ